MIGLIGCDGTFIRQLLSNPIYVAGTALRYGMLADELLQLLDDPALGANEMALLSALVSSMRLKGLQAGQLRCITLGALASIRGDYLPLGVCCSSSFFHDLQVSDADRLIFNNNNVFVSKIDEIDFDTIIHNTSHKVVRVITLSEGGNRTPVQEFGKSFHRAFNTVIYDRYFNLHSLRSLEELLTDAVAALGLLPGALKILCGQGPSGITEAQILATLAPFYSAANSVSVTRTRRVNNNMSHVHDRYIQLDDSTTFVLTAGLSSFYESGGLNRASQIFEMDLFVGYENLELACVDDNSRISVKY